MKFRKETQQFVTQTQSTFKTFRLKIEPHKELVISPLPPQPMILTIEAPLFSEEQMVFLENCAQITETAEKGKDIISSVQPNSIHYIPPSHISVRVNYLQILPHGNSIFEYTSIFHDKSHSKLIQEFLLPLLCIAREKNCSCYCQLSSIITRRDGLLYRWPPPTFYSTTFLAVIIVHFCIFYLFLKCTFIGKLATQIVDNSCISPAYISVDNVIIAFSTQISV